MEYCRQQRIKCGAFNTWLKLEWPCSVDFVFITRRQPPLKPLRWEGDGFTKFDEEPLFVISDTILQWQQQWKWHRLNKIQVKEHKKHDQSGRPKASASPEIEYKVEAQLQLDQAQWDKQIFQRSLFILGTNQVIDYWEDPEKLLQAYKEQHSVERGFRFIKDPNIVASSFFVKKPERAAALLFVMTTCLLNLREEHRNILALLFYWNFYS